MTRFAEPAAIQVAPRPLLAPTPLLEEQLALDATRGGERAALLKRSLALTDLLAALLAAGAAVLVAGVTGTGAWVLATTVCALWLGLAFSAGLYAVDTLGGWASGIAQLGRLFGTALLASWPLAGVAALVDADRPIVGALTASGLLIAGSAGGRTVARGVLHRIAPLRQRTLIVGSGVVAAQLADRLRRHHEVGLEPIGLIDDDVHPGEDTGLPILGGIGELRNILRRHAVDRVVIAFSRASHEELLDCMRACREQHVAVDVVPRLFELIDGARAVEQIGGLPVLEIGASRLSRSSAAAKRVMDVLIAAAMLVALAPLMAVVALAIKLESRGPVFFRQQRAGRGGEPFGLFKFRSMYDGADQRKAELAAINEQGDDVMFKIRRDPRVTKVGRVIRRTSLDELPQLLNVLRGEMSLVGPRPLVLPEAEALGSSWHARRLDLRPGLTGPWQVSGRSDLTVHDMVRLDFQYVTGWSLARDVELLLATVPVVLKARGAY
jgi:exopolysaccharide biosynthesis polyprenyl glycosylphosphotransferase